MNNEPVAWIAAYDLERLPLYDCWVNGEKSKGSVPLYAKPSEHDLGIAEAIGFDKGYKASQAENDELKATMRSFFEDFIDIREESDSGRVFAPITISSCRCMMIEPLAEVLAKMRTLSGATKKGSTE